MINIFGLRIVTGKDWDELKKEVKSIKAMQNVLEVDVMQMQKRYHWISADVRKFMDFVMTRMPLKRHRKEAREYFPERLGI